MTSTAELLTEATNSGPGGLLDEGAKRRSAGALTAVRAGLPVPFGSRESRWPAAGAPAACR